MALTRSATEADLASAGGRRLDEMLAAGTTLRSQEAAMGSVESELTQLRAICQLNRTHTIDIAPTFLGAHDIPAEFTSRRSDYITCIVNEMIPRVAAEGLAEWCDVFCDAGYFTPEEATAILDAGSHAGLKARIHADQLATSGGCRVAARVGARSADHLVHVDQTEADALASADVAAVLLRLPRSTSSSAGSRRRAC